MVNLWRPGWNEFKSETAGYFMHTRTTRTLRIAALELLYLPQVEQFGATLRPHGSALFGSIDSDVAEARYTCTPSGKAAWSPRIVLPSNATCCFTSAK